MIFFLGPLESFIAVNELAIVSDSSLNANFEHTFTGACFG
jgi:hypothetical protein